MTGIHCMLQDYIQSIGSCLLQIGEATEGPLVDVMHKLTDESSQLLGCIKLLNLKVHEAMLHGELDPILAKTQSMAHYYASSVVGLLATSLPNLSHPPLPCFCLFLFCITACTCCFVTAANRSCSDLGTLVSFFHDRAQHVVRRCSCFLPTSPQGTSCVCGIASLTYCTAVVQQSFSTPVTCKSSAVICLINHCTCSSGSSHCSTQNLLRP